MYSPATATAGSRSDGNKDFIVYCRECWNSDQWDAMTYGQEYTFQKSFFTTMAKLIRTVPHQALFIDGVNENSDFINCAGYSKNCYLVFNSGYNEDCYYSRGMGQCIHCMDQYYCTKNELCYELINCHNCYNTSFSQNSKQCVDSAFLYNCIGCKNCFGCTNLTHKENYLYNKPSTKEAVQEKMRHLSGHQALSAEKIVLQEEMQRTVRRLNQNITTEHCTGDYLTNCKNCRNCFELNNSEDCTFCDSSKFMKDSYDVFGHGYHSELLYETVGTGHAQRVLFTVTSDIGNELLCCYLCYSSKNCFGCFGLRNKEYCILNKQYTKEEYEVLVPKIIEKMMADGEWGEFFPASLSPFGYNESVANEYYPLTRDQVVGAIHESLYGPRFNWSDYEPPKPEVFKVIPANKLPDNIKDIPDDILNWAIECEVTQKPFRIIRQELQFYREHHLPIPRRHPDQRHKDRMALRNPGKLWDRNCMKCSVPIQTTYAPERKEIVYCEDCYLKEVY